VSVATIIAFVVSLMIQVCFPLAATLFFRRRYHTPWKLYGYGALVFAVFQIVSWLPVNVFLDARIGDNITSPFGAFLWLLTTAFLTSLTEEGGRWLGYRFLFPRHKYSLTWENGMMYGLGHASMETMLLIAGLTFLYFIAYLVFGQISQGALFGTLAPLQVSKVSATIQEILNTSWTQPIVVAVERILIFSHQLAWSLMVMSSRIAKRKRWFAFAVIYHWMIAVVVPGLARLYGFWVAEGVNLLLCGVSVLIIARLHSLLTEAQLS